MIATPVVALDQVPQESPSEENVVELFEQTVSVPLNIPASGALVTVAETAIFSFTAAVAEHTILSALEPEEELELNRT